MVTVCSRALLTAREMSAVRRVNVVSPAGRKYEMSFLPWETLSDVASRAASVFGLNTKSPVIRLPDGRIPPQNTELVCFVNGDELRLSDS